MTLRELIMESRQVFAKAWDLSLDTDLALLGWLLLGCVIPDMPWMTRSGLNARLIRSMVRIRLYLNQLYQIPWAKRFASNSLSE